MQGDPIEAAAASGLLLEHKQAQPLAMMAAKSSIGHSEPAAGVMNMLHACMALHSVATLPTLHLRSLNPHVTSAFDQSAAKGKVLLPRQATAMGAAQGGTPIVSGVSAFAFQGTNAHVLLQGAAASRAGRIGAGGSSLIWQQSRHWLAPQPHMLLTTFVKHAGTKLLMQCQLDQPKLAGFLDHQVMGKPLFPAAGFMELARASAVASLQPAALHSQQQQLVVAGISIPVPLELTTSSGGCDAVIFTLPGATFPWPCTLLQYTCAIVTTLLASWSSDSALAHICCVQVTHASIGFAANAWYMKYLFEEGTC